MNKTHKNKQPNATPGDDQWNGWKRLDYYGVLSSQTWRWHKKNNKKTRTSSLEDFEKEIICGL